MKCREQLAQGKGARDRAAADTNGLRRRRAGEGEPGTLPATVTAQRMHGGRCTGVGRRQTHVCRSRCGDGCLSHGLDQRVWRKVEYEVPRGSSPLAQHQAICTTRVKRATWR